MTTPASPQGSAMVTTLCSFGEDFPLGLAVAPDGSLIVATGESGVMKVTQQGVASVISRGTVDGVAFNWPKGVAVDSEGAVFIADTDNNRICKIDVNGVASVLAGGTKGSSDGKGTAASFHEPYGLAFDSRGNLVVADTWNHRIRVITPSGDVSTLAGSVAGFKDGSAAAALFYRPTGVAVDHAGNLYIADMDNNHIRKVTPQGAVSTVAGDGSEGCVDGMAAAASFFLPCAVVVGPSGELVVVDSWNQRIRSISPKGVVTTVAGSGARGGEDGVSTAASFDGPMGMAMDAQGSLYVVDDNGVRKVTFPTVKALEVKGSASEQKHLSAEGSATQAHKQAAHTAIDSAEVSQLEIRNPSGQPVIDRPPEKLLLQARA